MKHTLLSLVALYLAFTQLHAQVIPKPDSEDSLKVAGAMQYLQTQENIPKAPQTIQSPNAANFGSYGEIPISLYTGKPEISINLHEVSDGPIRLPIFLSYDAAGVRPDQHPGWVGMNFTLSTHYAVTRVVRDTPDDNKPNASTLGKHGYAYHTALINGVDWAQGSGIIAVANTTLNQIHIDTEPDEFTFSAPGLSGKFYLGSDAKWKVQCERPVKVQLINSGIALYPPFTPPTFTGNQWDSFNSQHYAEHFEGFIVTDDFGTQYIFGASDNSCMEYSLDFFDQGRSNWTCNSWYLKSIVRPTGQTIQFLYERGDFVAQMYMAVYNKMARVNGGNLFSCSNWSSLIGQMGPYSGKLISPVYLKQITADNFRIIYNSSISTELTYTQDIFEPYINGLSLSVPGFTKRDYLTYLYDCFYPNNTGPNNCGSPSLAQLLAKLKWRKLDKIVVQNGGGNPIKEFEFVFNNQAAERLMLQKVQEKSGYNANKLPAYEFTYYADPQLTLPGYCKSHTDHWGFNNGKVINVNTDFNDFGNYGLTYRSASLLEKYYRIGALSQIKYPTGGITKFWFEPHRYAKEVKLKRWEGEDLIVSNQIAGGLRIREVVSYDPGLSIPAVTKKYFYLANFNSTNPDTSSTALSSGVLGGKAQYYWPDYKPLPETAGVLIEEDIFSTQSVLPASENSMGAHIGYSQVVERSSSEGWKVFQFSNFDNPALFTTSVKTNMYWPNGQLDIEGQSDSRGRVIKTWYRYPPNQGDAASVAMTSKHIISPVVEMLNYTGLDVLPTAIKSTLVSYDLFSGSYQPKKVESKFGSAPSFIADIEFLAYDPRGNLLTYKELNGPSTKLEYFGLADIGKVDLLKKRTAADGTSIAQSINYTYKPAVGVETVQDPNGKTIFHEYDSFNRLKSAISNNAGGPRRVSYCYNLAGTGLKWSIRMPHMLIAVFKV